MGFRMYQPWEHPRSKVWWFRRRIPARLARFGIVAREIKESLRTKDWDEALIRSAERNLHYERAWRDLETGFGTTPDELTHRQIVALAGEFYREMVVRNGDDPGRPIVWEQSLQDLGRRKRPLVGGMPLGVHYTIEFGSEVDAFLRRCDVCLVGQRREDFVREYVAASEQAAKQLLRNAQGDYRPDPNRDRFGEFARSANGTRFEVLWTEFVLNKKLSPATQKKWKPYFQVLIHRMNSDDMARTTERTLLDWRDDLEKSELSPVTIRDGYLAAAKSFFGWAKRKKRLPTNPSAEVFVEVPESAGRKMRGFNDDEASAILSATLAPFSALMSKENAAARRWVPWLCAYTGARVNEMTQLRGEDVFAVMDLWCVRICPEAGTVKNTKERIVPLHPHLIEQGFVKFARRAGKGPLFYSPARQRRADRKNPTYASVGNKLAEWVRGLGIEDASVAPNHGWRHRFKTVGRRFRMDRSIVDAIQGHAPKTTGDDYGEYPPDAMAAEISKHPRYEVVTGKRVDRRRSG
jgi:integrase